MCGGAAPREKDVIGDVRVGDDNVVEADAVLSISTGSPRVLRDIHAPDH